MEEIRSGVGHYKNRMSTFGFLPFYSPTIGTDTFLKVETSFSQKSGIFCYFASWEDFPYNVSKSNFVSERYNRGSTMGLFRCKVQHNLLSPKSCFRFVFSMYLHSVHQCLRHEFKNNALCSAVHFWLDSQ